MNYFKNYRGCFTFEGITYSNAILKIDTLKDWGIFVNQHTSNLFPIVNGVKLTTFDYEDEKCRKVLHNIIPNEPLYWEHRCILLYDVHFNENDIPQWIKVYNDDDFNENAYQGRLSDTTGFTDWCCRKSFPTNNKEEAIKMLYNEYNLIR